MAGPRLRWGRGPLGGVARAAAERREAEEAEAGDDSGDLVLFILFLPIARSRSYSYTLGLKVCILQYVWTPRVSKALAPE